MVLEGEFKRFAVREDNRSIDPNTGKKERRDVNPDTTLNDPIVSTTPCFGSDS